MYPSKLEIDRNISKLRLNAKEFATISNEELAVLFQKVIDNIKTTSYYWISIASENKGYTKKQSQGEDWVSGPFSTILAIEYYIKYLNGEAELNERNFNTSDNSYLKDSLSREFGSYLADVEEFCRSTEICFLDSNKHLSNSADNWYFVDSVHLSDNGNRACAEIIYQLIQD